MTQTSADVSVSQVVPLFSVSDIQRSRRFYVDALGFTMTNQWLDGGKLRWCWLELGKAALMLQEFWYEGPHKNVPADRLGIGVSLNFQCVDAISLFKTFRAEAWTLRPLSSVTACGSPESSTPTVTFSSSRAQLQRRRRRSIRGRAATRERSE